MSTSATPTIMHGHGDVLQVHLLPTYKALLETSGNDSFETYFTKLSPIIQRIIGIVRFSDESEHGNSRIKIVNQTVVGDYPLCSNGSVQQKQGAFVWKLASEIEKYINSCPIIKTTGSVD